VASPAFALADASHAGRERKRNTSKPNKKLRRKRLKKTPKPNRLKQLPVYTRNEKKRRPLEVVSGARPGFRSWL
jgi:hypothetical protein